MHSLSTKLKAVAL